MNGMARANASAIRPDQLIAFGPKRISKDGGFGGTVFRGEHYQYCGNDDGRRNVFSRKDNSEKNCRYHNRACGNFLDKHYVNS